MKKTVILLGLLFSTGAFASADHYIRFDSGHVQHLKVSKQNNEVKVLLDVDFDKEGSKSCSAEIEAEAKVISPNELIVKKHASGDTHFCELKIHLSNDEARIEQSPDCAKFFAGGLCKFESEGKSLIKMK